MLGTANQAWAHTSLRSLTPAAGATVSGPVQVVLVFTDDVRVELSTVVVSDAAGVNAAVGDPRADATTITQDLRGPLAAGTWTVAYRVVAADGHPLVGTSSFVVRDEPAAGANGPAPSAGDAASSEPETAAGAADPTDEADRTNAAAGSVLPWLLLPLGLLAAVLWSRRKGSRSDAATAIPRP